MSSALFASLFDDAAMFPPGKARLEDAVPLHHRHRDAWYAPYVGPLLVSISSASRVGPLVSPDRLLEVVVIGRPDVEHHLVVEALKDLVWSPAILVCGVDAGWAQGWQRLIEASRTRLAIEVPRGSEQRRAITEIADAQTPNTIRAKFRTGATETWAWPDEDELAMFIHTTVGNDVSFKLTGGLHHAVRGDYGGAEQHGLLNVLNAVAAAHESGDFGVVRRELACRDAQTVVARTRQLDHHAISAVRSSFASYGCCGVTDPIGELVELGLIEAEA